MIVWVNKVKKALTSAGVLLVAINTYGGLPSTAKAYLAQAIAALAAFGLVHQATNKEV